MAKRSATNKLKRLKFLIGTWHTSGEILNSPSQSSAVIHGMDTYEWISAGHFILHRVDVLMGSVRTEVIEIIGYDEANGKYFMTSYDNAGAVVTMAATIEKAGVLKIESDKMRAVLFVNKNGSMSAKWDLLDKKWVPWMKIKLTQ
jgi:hypothetical protein